MYVRVLLILNNIFVIARRCHAIIKRSRLMKNVTRDYKVWWEPHLARAIAFVSPILSTDSFLSPPSSPPLSTPKSFSQQ